MRNRVLAACTMTVAVVIAGSLVLGHGPIPQQVEDLGTDAFGEPPSDDLDRLLAEPPRVPPGLRFGLDADGVDEAAQHGVRPHYGTVWVGAWTLQHGWGAFDAAIGRMVAANVTPAVHLYYWGDDIHADCFDAGCGGKTMADWDVLTRELADRLDERMGGRPAVIILETEFNKHQVHDFEPLDGHLAAKAQTLRAGFPAAVIVLGLGNWYPQAWGTWDRAAAESDHIGLQALAGSTHDSKEETVLVWERLLEGTRTANATFGKPVFIHDVAVSSHPEPDRLRTQGEALARLAHALEDLHAAGAQAIVYRSFHDVATVPLSEHYGEAERHWGLAWRDSGQLKPAGQAWIAAMKAARVG